MKQAVVLAPCKVNLTLDITRRRSDGYHEMEMILLAADLCDRVTVTLHSGRGIRVECDDQMVPLDEGNLAVRAARIFYQRTGLPAQGTDIAIEKRIPMEAGLAGGSADAAAVLVALNALCGTGLPLEELEAMALPLGADVPFCLRGGVVIARGIGEEFRILPALPDCFLAIAKPWEGVSTAAAFRRADELGIPRHPDTQRMEMAIWSRKLPKIAKHLYNVLEPAAGLPIISELKRLLLEQGALGAVMTGSGSAVVGLFEEESAAQSARERLAPLCQGVFVARPCAQGAHLVQLDGQ
ncbi:4-(cytidine 5'-diphospho)-2-C-methyl-D-erythritol kinase [Merdimmobilis hominis]|uniref:4-diphosphocytidyl-2-C-methyl-D-erythritol kinase n=1 Tax=uncultured Anaerotruncus sp. TaxID=905011 RepID=A0A6N2R1W1_9FIRM